MATYYQQRPMGNAGLLQMLQRRRFLQQQMQRPPAPTTPMQDRVNQQEWLLGRYGGPGPFNPQGYPGYPQPGSGLPSNTGFVPPVYGPKPMTLPGGGYGGGLPANTGFVPPGRGGSMPPGPPVFSPPVYTPPPMYHGPPMRNDGTAMYPDPTANMALVMSDPRADYNMQKPYASGYGGTAAAVPGDLYPDQAQVNPHAGWNGFGRG